MTSLPELKSCFYCTGTAERYGAKLHHGVQCINCGLQLSMTSHCARDEIVHVWNNITRAPSPHDKKPTTIEDAELREACECCGGYGRVECLPDSEHTHPCDDCNGELLKEFQRGYAAALALEPPITDDLRNACERLRADLKVRRNNGVNHGIFVTHDKDIETLINHAMKGQGG